MYTAAEFTLATSFMAVVTGRWTVDVTIHSRVRHTRLMGGWPGVAINTGERSVVRRHDMAVGTNRAIVGNSEIRMVKGRAKPIRGDPSGVASHASGWILR